MMGWDETRRQGRQGDKGEILINLFLLALWCKLMLQFIPILSKIISYVQQIVSWKKRVTAYF